MLDFSTLLSIDEYLFDLVSQYGFHTYLILFLIIFIETGVVFMPFLPGDSLLFAAGAIAAIGSLKISILILVLFVAAVVGDSVNYLIGKTWGRKIVDHAYRRKFVINYNHIKATEEFYERFGGKAIVLARFVPIIRTFAPFVAGIARMNYRRFFFYNIAGALAWVVILTLAGYWFGNIPIVKENFEIVVIVIIIISIMPAVMQFIKSRKKN